MSTECLTIFLKTITQNISGILTTKLVNLFDWFRFHCSQSFLNISSVFTHSHFQCRLVNEDWDVANIKEIKHYCGQVHFYILLGNVLAIFYIVWKCLCKILWWCKLMLLLIMLFHKNHISLSVILYWQQVNTSLCTNISSVCLIIAMQSKSIWNFNSGDIMEKGLQKVTKEQT